MHIHIISQVVIKHPIIEFVLDFFKTYLNFSLYKEFKVKGLQLKVLKKYSPFYPNKKEKEKSVMTTKEMRGKRTKKKNRLSESH